MTKAHLFSAERQAKGHGQVSHTCLQRRLPRKPKLGDTIFVHTLGLTIAQLDCPETNSSGVLILAAVTQGTPLDILAWRAAGTTIAKSPTKLYKSVYYKAAT